MNPIVALILGTLVLGERLPWIALCGALVLCCAVIVMSWQAPARRA